MGDDNEWKWFAVRTATRREKHVMTALYEMRQEHSLAAQFYLPEETRWGPYQRDGKTREPKTSPLLVGYLFVRMMPGEVWMLEDDATRPYGVHAVLTHKGDNGRRVPSPIPDTFIDKLKAAQDDGKFDRTKGKSRAKGVERAAWTKLSALANMSEDERLRALASYLGLKVEPEAEPEIDYSDVMGKAA